MFCSKCGKEIPDDSAFCPFCGETVTPGGTTAAPSPSVEQFSAPAAAVSASITGTQETKVSTGMLVGIIILTIFIPLVGLIMGPIYMKDPSQAKKKAGKIWLWVGVVSLILNLMVLMAGGF